MTEQAQSEAYRTINEQEASSELTDEQMTASIAVLTEKLGKAIEGERLDVTTVTLSSLLTVLVQHVEIPDYRKFLAAQVMSAALTIADSAQLTDEEVIALVMGHDAAKGAPVVAPAAPEAAFEAMAALAEPAAETEH